MADTELQAQEKLRWLGLESAAKSLSDITEEINLLDEYISDAGTFTNHLQNGYDYDGDNSKETIDDFTTFRKYLSEGSNSIGFTSIESKKFVEKIKQNFTDEDSSGTKYDEFQDFVIGSVFEFENMKQAFASTNEITGDTDTTQGTAAAGIRFIENEDGATSKDKDSQVTIPQGGVEVFGREVHFSQTKAVETGETSFSFKNIRVDDAQPNVGQTVNVEIDIDNTGNAGGRITFGFYEDGDRIGYGDVFVSDNSTETKGFDVRKSETEYHEYSIGDSSTVQVSWAPAELI